MSTIYEFDAVDLNVSSRRTRHLITRKVPGGRRVVIGEMRLADDRDLVVRAVNQLLHTEAAKKVSEALDGPKDPHGREVPRSLAKSTRRVA